MSLSHDDLKAFLGDGETRVELPEFLRGTGPSVGRWIPGRDDSAGGPEDAWSRGAERGPQHDEGAVEPEHQEAQGPCPNCEEVTALAEAQLEELEQKLREPYLNGALTLEQTAVDLTRVMRRDLVRLAVRLAETIVHRVVEIDPAIAEETVARALQVAGGVQKATLLVHEHDLEAIRERAPELAAQAAGKAVDIDVRASDKVARGSCMVQLDQGTVDARWHAQLLQLRDLIEAITVEGAAGQGGGGE